MIKYNIVVCCYDTVLVNVVAFVIPGYKCVCVCVCVCVCGAVPVYSAPHAHLTRNCICSHIYQDGIITTHYYIVSCHFNNS